MTAVAQTRADSRRAIQRASCNFPADIKFGGVLLCKGIIKNISIGGIRLLVPRRTWLPSEFEIETEVFDYPVSVRTVWSNKEHIGVKFDMM